MRQMRGNAIRLHRRRGAALVEFALAIPLLGTIIVATFFFGWAMQSQQRVKISDRYDAWRRVGASEGVTPQQLNETFFRNRTSQVDIYGGTGPGETRQELVAEAAGQDETAGELASRLVIDNWPAGRSSYVYAEFIPAMDAWRHFTGPIRSRHVREGLEWRRGQAYCEYVLRDMFLQELDELLDSTPAPGDALAEQIRQLYLARW